jgi:hypothetical protein
LFASLSSYAQVTTDSIKRQDSIRRANLKLKAAEIRKQIDSLKAIEKSIKKKLTKKDSLKIWSGEGRFTFLLNQSAYSNWISGGENTVAAGMVVNYDFNYKKNKWKWDNKIISSYGSSYIANQGYRKTDDRFEYNSVLAYNTGKSWYYSFFSNFITQYSNGFEFSDDSRERVSTFFSPAYWSYGPGVLWRKNENYRINIAPATSRFTFVAEAFSGEYGVEEGETSNYGLGFNLSSYVKFKILDNLTMENIIQMYADYLEKPQNVDVNYQINLFLSFTKRLSTNITFHAIVDDNAVNMLQFRQLFGLGFNYTFHKI